MFGAGLVHCWLSPGLGYRVPSGTGQVQSMQRYLSPN
ncbi:hypothetical protein SFR_4286 [Streptomyces sp. FR-008]|nr:hypothetical protein SFR_4286 [Streptomyces sp. FR-008]